MVDYVTPEELEPHAQKVIKFVREAAEAPPSTLRVTYVRDFGDEDLEKVWLVEDFLGQSEATAFYGLPGCGKSVVIADGAAHVATGRSWFGRAVNRGAVVILAAERAKLVRRRLKAWQKFHRVDDLPIAVVDGIFDLCTGLDQARDVVRIVAQAEVDLGLPVVWIIVDTKQRAMAGGDPNSDQDVGAFIASVGVMQETGAHVTIVDHVPHTAPDRLKGSGALAGAVDGSFLVKNEGFARTITIGSKPPNDGPEELRLAFELKGVEIHRTPFGKVTEAPVVIRKDPNDGMMDPDKPVAGGRKANDEQTIILRALGQMEDADECFSIPRLPGVPVGTRGVPQDKLRAWATKIGYVSGNGSAEVIRSSFNRQIRSLIAAEVLRGHDGMVWRCR